MCYIPELTSDKIIIFRERRLLTKEDVNALNNGEDSFRPWLKGNLEWNDEYDYYHIPATGSFIVKVKKDS
jgi:hypothetical protein